MTPPTPLVLPFTAISTADLPIVGGKGANLGEMTQAGFPIPPGFCLTTAAFQQFMAAYPQADALYVNWKDSAPVISKPCGGWGRRYEQR